MRRLLKQIIQRPMTAFASSIEMLGHRVQRRQRVDAIVSRIAHTLSRASSSDHALDNLRATLIEDVDGDGRQVSQKDASLLLDTRQSVTGSSAEDVGRSSIPAASIPEVAYVDGAQAIPEREEHNSKDLRDDMLKLVQYKILFVKRGYEYAFPEKEAFVSENLDETAFTTWKIAEFMQELQKGEISIPRGWRDKNYPNKSHIKSGKLIGLDNEDKKYLRVYYEVLERYPREKSEYKKEQIRILEDIRDAF